MFASGEPAQFYATLIASGMTFGFIGDLFMANVITHSKSKSVMGGIGGFAIGHLFYIAGILWTARELSLDNNVITFGSLILFWALAFITWQKVVMFKGDATVLHWAALPYALLLATTAGLAMGIALQQIAFWPLALGAMLFLLSDAVLANALFGKFNVPLHHDIVWLLYGPGQMLIVFSVGASLKLIN